MTRRVCACGGVRGEQRTRREKGHRRYFIFCKTLLYDAKYLAQKVPHHGMERMPLHRSRTNTKKFVLQTLKVCTPKHPKSHTCTRAHVHTHTHPDLLAYVQHHLLNVIQTAKLMSYIPDCFGCNPPPALPPPEGVPRATQALPPRRADRAALRPTGSEACVPFVRGSWVCCVLCDA